MGVNIVGRVRAVWHLHDSAISSIFSMLVYHDILRQIVCAGTTTIPKSTAVCA